MKKRRGPGRSSFIDLLFICFALASPIAAGAQFQQPTDEELKMTADPKAPGAAAVYLYREETNDEDKRLRTYYARIKVLTEKGKDLATIRTPFVPNVTKVDQVEGRTIHADGTVIPLTVKPEDLVDFKSKYFQEDTLVFTLPSVEVGSILEYRLQIENIYGLPPLPRWDLQSAYPIRKEHFLFNSGPEGGWYTDHGKTLDRLAGIVSPPKAPTSIQGGKGKFTVDLTDVPPAPEEDWMPPINTIRWRAEFFHTYAHTEKEFWDTEPKFWASDTDEFAKATGTIKKAAASLVSAEDSDEQKAQKIYAAVMKLENTDFSRVKSEAERKKEKLKEIHRVEDVWKNQAGGGNSIALLYVALARAAGLKIWPMQVVDRSNAIFDPNFLSAGQLEDYIAILDLGGKEVYVDPGQKLCPFGALHWAHTVSAGFREAETGPTLAQTPASSYKQNVVQRAAYLTIDAEGNVKGTARFVLAGAASLYWRQRALQNDLEEVKKQFIEEIQSDLPEGVESSFDHFVGLDDYESNLMAAVNITGKMGTATGKRMILPGLFFESRAKHPFISEDKRATPIDVHYPVLEKDDVVYHLPPGYAVESAPPKNEVAWPKYAELTINSQTSEDTIEVGRAFARNFSVLGAEGYNDLHDFYLKLAAADQQQIVLARAAKAKGN